MNRKLSELKEKFIIYYSEDNYIHIYSIPVNKITKDEFMKCDIPCKDCLVQTMCLLGTNSISHLVINDGIKIQLCDRMKEFIIENESLFNRVTFKTTY
jgi:hypothetical protein